MGQPGEGGSIGPQVLDCRPDTESRFGDVRAEEAFGCDDPVAGLELDFGKLDPTSPELGEQAFAPRDDVTRPVRD